MKDSVPSDYDHHGSVTKNSVLDTLAITSSCTLNIEGESSYTVGNFPPRAF